MVARSAGSNVKHSKINNYLQIKNELKTFSSGPNCESKPFSNPLENSQKIHQNRFSRLGGVQ